MYVYMCCVLCVIYVDICCGNGTITKKKNIFKYSCIKLLIFQAINMEPDRLKMTSLFGEDHYTSDEELVQHQQSMKRRLHEAFGSDSESDVLELEHTDISEDEGELELSDMIHQKTRNNNENKCKELNEAKGMVVQSVKRMQIIQPREKTVDQKKALAQYQRRIAARITKGQTQNNIQIPESIIITNEVGQPIHLNEVDIVKDESEIMREADRAIHGKHIIETLIQVIPHQHEKTKNLREPEEPFRQDSQMIAPNTNMEVPRNETIKLSRRERKRKWYKKKTAK
uniref:Uncharacterized protein n=1 Tax=Schizaphis graminum TaxID=13262 RepID=A0A2S2NAH5_SCHGA